MQPNEEKSLKKLRCIQRSVDRHWAGDGFPVRTLFGCPNLGSVLSPFLLFDYAGPKYEVDFAFWYRCDRRFDQNEEPVLAFGEAKSFAEESFKARDIQRMETLGKKFPGAFLVFATMKDRPSYDVNPPERSARSLRTWH
jgi:hypothetical protein